MELSLSKLPWHGQIGAFVVRVGARGVRLLELLRRQRCRPTSTRAETRLTALRADVAKGVATARRLPQFQAEVAAARGRLENLRAVLPEEKDVADILRRVQGLATQSNLTIQRFTPQPPQAGSDVCGAAVQAEGRRDVPRPRVLLRSDQQVPPNHQRRRHHDQGEAGLRGSATIEAECIATTFVLQEAGAAGAGRGGRGVVPEAAVSQMSAYVRRMNRRRPLAALAVAIAAERGRRCAAARCRAPGGVAACARDTRRPRCPRTGRGGVRRRAAVGRGVHLPRRGPAGSVRQPAWARQHAGPTGSRPAGVAGLLISEISIKGIVRDGSGFIAMVQGPDNRAYVVRAGDRLMDGTVKAMVQDAVVFSQDVNDPLSLVKQKEIRKNLRSTEGGRG